MEINIKIGEDNTPEHVVIKWPEDRPIPRKGETINYDGFYTVTHVIYNVHEEDWERDNDSIDIYLEKEKE